MGDHMMTCEGGQRCFVDISSCQTEHHHCTRNCAIRHVIGNMFECASSGQMHICDANCTQRVVYDNVSTICRLSRKVFPLTQQELLCRSGSLKKRTSGEFGMVDQGDRKRSLSSTAHTDPAHTSPFSPVAMPHRQHIAAPVPFTTFPSPTMAPPAPGSPFAGSPFAPAGAPASLGLPPAGVGSPFAQPPTPFGVAQTFMVQ